MVEPRRRRAEFLVHCVDELALSNATVVQSRVETVDVAAAVISARAVAPIDALLRAASARATPSTRWLFPRGRFTPDDVDELRGRWHGMFHVKQSLTESTSSIVIAEGVRAR